MGYGIFENHCVQEVAVFNYATTLKNLDVILCGLSATWIIIEKVEYDKGGLHNSLIRTMRLMPFTVAETHVYLSKQNNNPKPYQLLQLYMAIGVKL